MHESNDFDNLLMQYALNDKNYKKWRMEHTKVFGKTFSSAFADNPEAQIHLTAALINICSRNFAAACPKLDILEKICVNDFDEAVVIYFKGLNFEMLAKETEMCEYYERLKNCTVSLSFPFAFHPYYRTAKFAQRDSECSKAIYYYKKALEFYDGTVPDESQKSTVSKIIYDIATLYMVMHQYNDSEAFLKISEQYDPSENSQRNYVKAVLFAVLGKEDEARGLAEGLNSFYREHLDPMITAITNGTDPHYCETKQDRSGYEEFWCRLLQVKPKLEAIISKGRTSDAEEILSSRLSNTLAFMKRKLDCRIEMTEDEITVKCKNYRVKTLMKEYEALFSKKPSQFDSWRFSSVDEFLCY